MSVSPVFALRPLTISLNHLILRTIFSINSLGGKCTLHLQCIQHVRRRSWIGRLFYRRRLPNFEIADGVCFLLFINSLGLIRKIILIRGLLMLI